MKFRILDWPQNFLNFESDDSCLHHLKIHPTCHYFLLKRHFVPKWLKRSKAYCVKPSTMLISISWFWENTAASFSHALIRLHSSMLKDMNFEGILSSEYNLTKRTLKLDWAHRTICLRRTSSALLIQYVHQDVIINRLHEVWSDFKLMGFSYLFIDSV